MVFVCCVVDCCGIRVKSSGVSFYKIPTIITSQGAKTLEITTRRRNAWLAKINRKKWSPSDNTRICSRHFFSGNV